MSIIAGVVEESALRLQCELSGHCLEAPAALVAPAELDNGVVKHLRIDEVDIAGLGQVNRGREGVPDGEVWHANPR